mmetsp:Transcript_16/g.58  ORF Transcript_16/g.58 Transcript_16/m.58 type:complete len:218 (+) Transcript_16:155-808(+)
MCGCTLSPPNKSRTRRAPSGIETSVACSRPNGGASVKPEGTSHGLTGSGAHALNWSSYRTPSHGTSAAIGCSATFPPHRMRWLPARQTAASTRLRSGSLCNKDQAIVVQSSRQRSSNNFRASSSSLSLTRPPVSKKPSPSETMPHPYRASGFEPVVFARDQAASPIFQAHNSPSASRPSGSSLSSPQSPPNVYTLPAAQAQPPMCAFRGTSCPSTAL